MVRMVRMVRSLADRTFQLCVPLVERRSRLEAAGMKRREHLPAAGDVEEEVRHEDRVQEGVRDAELRLSLRGRRGGKKDYAPHEGRADLERATAAQLIRWTRATNLTQNGYGWH